MALYRKKCGACHHPYAPVEIKAGKWDKTILEMAQRAKLTPEEVTQVRAYIQPDLVRPMASH